LKPPKGVLQGLFPMDGRAGANPVQNETMAWRN